MNSCRKSEAHTGEISAQRTVLHTEPDQLLKATEKYELACGITKFAAYFSVYIFSEKYYFQKFTEQFITNYHGGIFTLEINLL